MVVQTLMSPWIPALPEESDPPMVRAALMPGMVLSDTLKAFLKRGVGCWAAYLLRVLVFCDVGGEGV